MKNRDDFNPSVKRQLAERTGYKCSNPCCRISTIGAQMGDKGTVSIGEAAHIYAAAPGGKRYNAHMTSEERKSYENGIWMCRTHAALIDRDEKFFTIKMLLDWKDRAEKNSSAELVGFTEKDSKCRLWMKLLHKDLMECKKWIELLVKKRGLIINTSNLPIQNNWEIHIEEISDVIGCDIAVDLNRLLREISDFKSIMDDEAKRTGGRPVADRLSIRYCQRKDLFAERMEDLFTEEFMEMIAFFAEI